MKFLPALTSAMLLAGALAAQDLGRETRVDSVLASVNGEPITLLDVMLESGRGEMRLASLFSGARLYSETAKLRRQVVEEIIVRKLVYARYTAKPFPIDDQYIENMLDHLAQSIGGGSRSELLKKADDLGITLNELKQKVKEKIAVDILLREACSRPVFVTPKEVYDYYCRHGKEWTTPARYALELLRIARTGGRSSGTDPKELCRQLAGQVKAANHEQFTKLVKIHSDAPNADRGGATGPIDADKLRPEFAPAVLKMTPGEIAGPLETPEGFYFIRLDRILPEEKIPYEKAAGKIRNRLELRRKEDLRRAYGDKLKKQALIRYYF